MAYSQSDYQTDVQALIPDIGYPDESSRIVEDLTSQVVGGNGSRLTFNLSHINVAPSGAQIAINEQQFTPNGFTVDNTNGIVIFASGNQPTLSSSYPYPTKFEVLYYYQHFQLSDLDIFINYGLGKFKIFPMTGNNATTDYQNLTPDIYNCVLLYAVSQAFYRLASKYSRTPNVSAEGKSAGKGSLAQRYLELAKEYEDKAEKERVAVYGPRQGRSTAASLQISHNINNGRGWQNGFRGWH